MKNEDVIKHGFTLIELLVVVLIIGILAAVAVPQYKRAVDKVKFMHVSAIADAVYKAQEVFKLANGYYTTDFNELSIDIPSDYSERTTSDGRVYSKIFYSGNGKVECLLTTEPARLDSPHVTCYMWSSGLPKYTIRYGREGAPHGCVSDPGNNAQEKFCERITGSVKSDGFAWVNSWIWVFK